MKNSFSSWWSSIEFAAEWGTITRVCICTNNKMLSDVRGFGINATTRRKRSLTFFLKILLKFLRLSTLGERARVFDRIKSFSLVFSFVISIFFFFLPSPLPQLSSRHSLSSRYLLAYLCQWIKKSTGSSLSSWMMEKKLKTCQMGEMSLNIHAWLTKDYAMLFYESLLSRICCRFDIFLLLSLYTPLSISCHLREKMSNKECCTRRIFSRSCSHIVCIRMFSVAIQFLQLGLPLSAPIDFNLSSRKPEPLQSIELTISLALLAVLFTKYEYSCFMLWERPYDNIVSERARERATRWKLYQSTVIILRLWI